VIGTAAVIVAPSLQSTPPRDTSTAALVSQRLEPVPVPSEAAAKPAAPKTDTEALTTTATEAVAVPKGSGSGRRIVFDQSQQRVWLIGADDRTERTYLVSGSKHENLKPGHYRVQSKTRHATAFDGSGTMEYFVRFATGFREPIGFHSVPKDNRGLLEQTKEQLGTRLSAGCVRQWLPDAIALWDFAPVGTPVVVVA